MSSASPIYRAASHLIQSAFAKFQNREPRIQILRGGTQSLRMGFRRRAAPLKTLTAFQIVYIKAVLMKSFVKRCNEEVSAMCHGRRDGSVPAHQPRLLVLAVSRLPDAGGLALQVDVDLYMMSMVGNLCAGMIARARYLQRGNVCSSYKTNRTFGGVSKPKLRATALRSSVCTLKTSLS